MSDVPESEKLLPESHTADGADADNAAASSLQTAATEPQVAATPAVAAEVDPVAAAEAAAARKELLRLAMKAFRKRLKLTILDDESRLGRGPMSGGSKSSVIAITPPNQFPRDVWEELAQQGKLKRAGKGVYELTE